MSDGTRVVLGGLSAVTAIGLLVMRIHAMDTANERAQAIDIATANFREASNEWKRVSLPGFSVELPGTAPAPTGDYTGGMIQESYPNQYGISWMQGVTPDELDRNTVSYAMVDAVQQTAHITLTASGDRVITVAGKRAHEMDFKAPTGETANLVFATCGSRLVQFTVVGTSSLTASSTLKHMLDSFECTPDPTKEATRDEVAVTPTKGWKRVSNDTSYLILENRDGARISSVAFVEQAGLGFDQQLEAAMKLAGYHLHKGPKHGTKSSWVGTFVDTEGSTPLDVVVLAWKCPNRIATITVPIGSASAMALAETGRCLGPDDAVPVY